MAFGFGWLSNIRKVPFLAAKELREAGDVLRSLAKAGDLGVTHVTASHPDQKISALGVAFEEILASPVVAGFLRHKPKLYMIDHGTEAIPRIGKVIGPSIKGKYALIDSKTVAEFSIPELKAFLAHEVGHHVRLDNAPRFALRKHFASAFSGMEKDADRISVAITGDAASLDAVVKKIKKIHPEMAEGDRLAQHGSLSEKIKLAENNATYLPPEARSEFIQGVGAQVSTPEGRSHVEAEIRRRLQKEHDRLNAHHTHRS